MRSLLRHASVSVSAIALVAVTGCGTAKDTRFYVLTPLPATERPRDASSGRAPAIGLRPVGLPEQLDRPQIVTRVGENTLHLAEFDQWAAPLRDNFTRVLAENLSILVPTDRVAVFPWGNDASIDYEVAVEVTRFEGTLGGDSSLVAHWAIFKRGGKERPARGTSSHSEPAGGNYTTLVMAQNRLVAALSRDIATALKAIPR